MLKPTFFKCMLAIMPPKVKIKTGNITKMYLKYFSNTSTSRINSTVTPVIKIINPTVEPSSGLKSPKRKTRFE